MALGAGCWGPGIAWDAENSARLVGPRTAAWPYAACPVSAASALKLDMNQLKLWVEPADMQFPISRLVSWGAVGSQPANQQMAVTGVRYAITDGTHGAPIQQGAGPNPWFSVPTPSDCSSNTKDLYGVATLTTSLWIGTNQKVTVWGDCAYAMLGDSIPADPLRSVLTAPMPAGVNLSNLVDLSGNGVTGTVNNPLWADAQSGTTLPASVPGYLHLAGSNASYGVCPNASTSLNTGFSVAVWARPVSTGSLGFETIFSMDGIQGTVPFPPFEMGWSFITTTSGNFGMNGQIPPYPSGGSWTSGMSAGNGLGNWSHLCVTYDGTTFRSYVNGVASSTATHPIANGQGGFHLGAELDWSGSTPVIANPFLGDLAHAMFYGSALTPAQVTQLYTTPNSPPAGSHVWYPLNYAYPRRVMVQAHGTMTAQDGPAQPAPTWGVMPCFNVQNDVITSSSLVQSNPCFVEFAEVAFNGAGFTRRTAV